MRHRGRETSFEYHERPGLGLDASRLDRMVAELRTCASHCFPELPSYQCLLGTRAALEDKIITVARDADGTMIGFCSAVVLPIRGVGDVLHLGLTCVSPFARGRGLTHRLTGRLVTRFLLRHRPFGRLWVTNVACVLSSLGNVALHFRDVFPAPGGPEVPSRTHRLIAEGIHLHHRADAFIDPAAVFDGASFVFRGSVAGTMFQKRADDTRFHHRDAALNAYYAARLDFDAGDEVLQVGCVTLGDGLAAGLRAARSALERGLSGRPRLQGDAA
ncbi:hypothetical protein L6V77_23350 [Myxococcota bacterium]|nr:hypothetical protein [Myxococcota bacterium]